MACGQIESGRARHALVVGADFLSRFLDFSDRDTAPLFADGAGAAVVSATEEPDRSDRADRAARRSLGSHLIRLDRGDLIRDERSRVVPGGGGARMSEATTEALASCDCAPEDIGLFVYHQANSRIIRAVGQRLGLPDERVVDYVDRFANASTATLPIALSVAEAEGRLKTDDLVLLAAFGGGLTWGATVMQWSAGVPSPRAAQPSVTPTV